MTEELLEIANKMNGYVTTDEVGKNGIPRRKLSEAVDHGVLIKLDRGLYALPDTWEDPLFIAQHRFSRGRFSDDTALYLLGCTDRVPFSLSMTFPRGYNASHAREAGIICRSCADEVLGLGAISLRTQHGNLVNSYDLERTLCDMVRGQQVIDIQVVVPAMKAYVKSEQCNPAKLMRYARALGVAQKVRNYLEVLL